MDKIIVDRDITFPDVSDFDDIPIDLTYLPTDRFVNYINLLFKKYSYIVCNIDLENINEYFIEIDVVRLTYKISVKLLNTIEACKQNVHFFYIIPIHLRFPNQFEMSNDPEITSSGHSNIVIINNNQFTIQLFEPHGVNYSGFTFDVNTKRIIEKVIKEIFPLEKSLYHFENLYEGGCPYFGVQRNDLFCLAWSLLLVELRLLNPFVTSESIIDVLSSYDYDSNLKYLHNYINYISYQLYTNVLTGQVYITNYEGYSTFNIKDIQLTDVIKEDVLVNRIQLLLDEYFRLQYLEDSENISKKQLIFEELISYRKYTYFHNVFFKYINSKV